MSHNKNFVNFYRIDPNNIGDFYSSPIKYFDFLKKSKAADIAPRRFRRFIPNIKNKMVIIGGGGLIGHHYFESKIMAIMKAQAKHIIFWGAGHNIHGNAKIIYPDYLKSCDLVGVRDFGFDYEWVPCPSCMHAAFDRKYTLKHKIVVYENALFGRLGITGYPKLGNNSSKFEDIIAFLGSGEIILSSSYHGIYWGMLLNKKVIVIDPFSSKFNGLKYKVPFASCTDWDHKKEEAVNYPQFLDECRDANSSFAQKVKNLASG